MRIVLLSVAFGLLSFGCGPGASTPKSTFHATFTSKVGVNAEADFSDFDAGGGILGHIPSVSQNSYETNLDATGQNGQGERKVEITFADTAAAGQSYAVKDFLTWGAVGAIVSYTCPQSGGVFEWVSSGGGTLTIDSGSADVFTFTLTGVAMKSYLGLPTSATGTFTVDATGDVKGGLVK